MGRVNDAAVGLMFIPMLLWFGLLSFGPLAIMVYVAFFADVHWFFRLIACVFLAPLGITMLFMLGGLLMSPFTKSRP